jgi:hypothetical protein
MAGRKSGLGRILRGISEKDSPDKKVSVVDAINKACAGGLTSAGAFSVLGIKRKLKELLRLMESDEFDRDSFFLEFFNLYNLVMAPDKRAKGVFHPSQLLDGCMREMAYDLLGTEPTDSRGRLISPELQRIFDVGTWYHIYIQAILFNIGYLEQAEVPVVNKEKYLNGKTDGVFKEEVFGEKVVLEIKTMNNWNFTKAIFKPFKKHEFQASLYARELGIKKVLYLYINKDTSEIREFLEPVSEEQLAIADKKMNKVIAHVEEKTLPPRKCSDKFCDAAADCVFASLCFK